MSDRELLELAAKAAGYDFEWYCRGANNPNGIADVPCVDGSEWNPLTDDGDALRIAVACKIDILTECDDGTIGTIGPHGDEKLEVADGDVYAAIRRAIVREAAEIGRSMP